MATTFHLVPDELLCRILSFLSINKVSTLALVSKRFSYASQHDLLWSYFTKEVFGEQFGRKLESCTCWKEEFKELTKYTWDQTYDSMTQRKKIGYNNPEKEVEFISPVTCRKLQANPDISFALGKVGFSEGIVGFKVTVDKMNDELYIGVTDTFHHYYQKYTTYDPHLWIWCDGRKDKGWTNGNGGKVLENLPRYKEGDVLGFVLDFPREKIGLWMNGNHVATIPLPTPRPLWPVCCMDYANDVMTIGKLEQKIMQEYHNINAGQKRPFSCLEKGINS